MSKEQANRFLDDYKADRSVMEKVESIFDSNPDMKDADLWAQAAKECGYEFTPEELDEAFHEREQVIPGFTEEEVDTEELAAVSGGADYDECNGDFQGVFDKHDECKDTFISKENCWHNDGCDKAYHIYSKYQCKYSGECDYAFAHR